MKQLISVDLLAHYFGVDKDLIVSVAWVNFIPQTVLAKDEIAEIFDIDASYPKFNMYFDLEAVNKMIQAIERDVKYKHEYDFMAWYSLIYSVQGYDETNPVLESKLMSKYLGNHYA